MLAYFIYGLNALTDAGNSITIKQAYDLIEKKNLIRYLNENYKLQYWDFTVLVKYEENLSTELLKYDQILHDDYYRKYGVKNNGFLLLSSLVADILLEKK